MEKKEEYLVGMMKDGYQGRGGISGGLSWICGNYSLTQRMKSSEL